jgi:hypothetical protein
MMLTTNRDLYLALNDLSKTHASNTRTLEQYSLALLALAQPYSKLRSLSLMDFYNLIADAFTAEPLAFDESWRIQDAPIHPENPGFAAWHSALIGQIVDLREMDEVGTLKDEYRYFGLSAPSGRYWYNFDIKGYLECAMAGTWRGWEPGDDTNRHFVSGQVTVLDEAGTMQSVNPEDVSSVTAPIACITWEDFLDFIECGQMYE